jgi:hypothetical protein
MPLYDLKCDSCGLLVEDYYVSNLEKMIKCKQCGEIMRQLFPMSVHTKIGSVIDSKNVGKRIREKNEKLKKRESGYAHEEQNLRKKITKLTEERLKNQ